MSTVVYNGKPAPNGCASAPVLAVVADLFFQAKIQETARLLGVKVGFIKSAGELLETDASPSLVILDLNCQQVPLESIHRLRRDPRFRKTSLIGFLSHLQAELKVKAQEAGCDMVMPRSAFSQNLPALLKRHGLPAE